MTRKHWLAVMGAIGAAAAATGCQNKGGPAPSVQGPDYSVRIDSLKVQIGSLKNYLSNTDSLYKWEVKVTKAICQLELAAPSGLKKSLQICPEGWGPGGGGDVTPPPSYPK